MKAAFAYYTETEGKIRFIRDGKKSNDIGYLLRPRLDLVTGSLVVPIPETIEGTPVTLVEIIPELPDDRPVPTLPSPLIRRLYIPSKVRHLRIMSSIVRNSSMLKETEEEKFNPLNGCTVEISPDNRKYCVFGQGIYSADMTKLYYIFSPGETFSVPHGVRTIKDSAGCSVKGLRKILIPDSVAEVGNCAFEGCTDLAEAEIGAKILNTRAFYGCSSLTSLSLKNTKEFYNETFKGCGDIETILKDAFKFCREPKKINIRIDKCTGDFELSLDCEAIMQPQTNDPDTSSFLGSSPFRENKHLRKLTLTNIEGVDYSVFAQCSTLDALVIENTAVIGIFAFLSCHALRYAVVDCKEIYDNAFNSCKSLETVTLKNTEIIRGGAFSHCEALKEIKLPDTLRKLGEYAFYETSIQRLIVPPGVEEIGNNILSSGVLELTSVNGELAPPCEDILCAGEPGVMLAVRCAETNEILYKLDLSYNIAKFFSEFGIDTDAYNETRSQLLGYYGALFSARSYLRRSPNTQSSVFEPLKQYVSDLSALKVLEMINDSGSEELWNYAHFDDIDGKRFLNLIDYCTKQHKPEMTAFLMQKLHERGGGNEPGLEL